MLFIYREALENKHSPDDASRSAIYFHDKKTGERFSAICLTLIQGKELESETTAKGHPLFESSSEWLIENDKGDTYTRRVEHRVSTDIFHPDGWDEDQTESTPIALYAMSCSRGGSIRLGIDADKWVNIERGDL